MSETQLFPLAILREALKKSGLPSTRPTIISYERIGLIRPGKFSVIRNSRIDRLYTKEEVGEIIKNVREFKARSK